MEDIQYRHLVTVSGFPFSQWDRDGGKAPARRDLPALRLQVVHLCHRLGHDTDPRQGGGQARANPAGEELALNGNKPKHKTDASKITPESLHYTVLSLAASVL